MKTWFIRILRPLDLPLIYIVLGLSLAGLITLFSATNQDWRQIQSQLINFLIAGAAMWLIASTPPQRLMQFSLPLYIVGMILLLAVFFFGDVSKGAQRWLNIGFTRIQPSELMKIALPMMLAWYLNLHENAVRARHLFIASILMLLPVALVLKQPDLGTSLLIFVAGFFVLYLAGLSWKLLIPGLVLCLCLGWYISDAARCGHLLHDYQCSRIQTLIDPSSDPLGRGYHTIQGTIAIGSGGFFGKGWLNGSQTHLDYIPERHTDFIFAVYSEEFGLFGNLLLLGGYALLILRGISICLQAASLFARLLSGAITMSFFAYAFVNMGMVSGILPVVGVPLPFFSYGGTALVTLFASLGLLMSVHKHRSLINFR